MKSNPYIAFFGTPEFAVVILETLKESGFVPSLIITREDKPKGRNLALTPPPIKVWADKNNIQVLQPKKLDSEFINFLSTNNYQLFIVAAYGKILPKALLEIPKHGVLNVHPSLLPKFRGAAPVEGAILAGDKITGVSIMLLDEEMDHGPVIAQDKIELSGDEKAPELEERLAKLGGELLGKKIPEWISGKIKALPQNHAESTYTKKTEKADGLIDLTADALENYRKFRAYYGWPGAYFFVKHKGENERVSIKEAELKHGKFTVKQIVPEGKKEMNYEDFLRGLK